LIEALEKAGLVCRGGKGSHRNYMHVSGVVLTISGKLGNAAKPYQERLVQQKIRESQE